MPLTKSMASSPAPHRSRHSGPPSYHRLHAHCARPLPPHLVQHPKPNSPARSSPLAPSHPRADEDAAVSSARRRGRRGEARRPPVVTADDRRKECKDAEALSAGAPASPPSPAPAAAPRTTSTAPSPTTVVSGPPDSIGTSTPNHLLQPARAAVLGFGGAATGLAADRNKTSGALRWTSQAKGHIPGHADDSGVQVETGPKETPASPAPPAVSTTALHTDHAATSAPPLAPAHPTPATIPAVALTTLSVLPDLTRVATAAHTAFLVSRPPPPTYNGRPGTRPFSLHPPAYTDADIPPPKPYNKAYPHPLTAYASPGVNPHTVRASGYGEMLDKLVKHDMAGALGEVLYEAGFRDLQSSVYLLLSYEGNGNGNGIPESMWSKFDSAGAAKLPFAPGAAQTQQQPQNLPPRFAQHSISPSYPFPSVTSSGEGDRLYRLVAATHQRDLLDDPTPGPSPDTNPHGWQTRTPRPCERERQLYSSLGEAASSIMLSGRLGDEGMAHAVSTARDSGAWKTEICVAWETTRMCQYGTECQFAHGIDDLQLTRRDLLLRSLEPISPAPTYCHRQVGFLPSTERATTHSSQRHDDTLFPNLQQLKLEANRSVLSRHLSQLPQLPASFMQEPRRMSAPHTSLPMVPEMDCMARLHQLHQAGHRRQSEVALPSSNPSAPIPPIGMERSTSSARAESEFSASASTPSLGWNPLDDNDWPIPPYSYTPCGTASSTHLPDLPTTLRSRPSTLSLCTSSSSRFSGYTTYSDASPQERLYTPVDADITITEPTVVGTGSESVAGGASLGMKLKGGVGVGTTTLDFSTGKSIWR